MSPLLKQLALELATELRAAKNDPAAINRINENVNRSVYANHPELIARERAAAAREAS